MMYPSGLNHDQAVLDQIRFIDWRYEGGESPSQDDLVVLGENVVLDCIDKSSANIGEDVNVVFAAYRKGRGEILTPLKGLVTECFGPKDDFELFATFKYRSPFPQDGGVDGSRKWISVEDVVLYSGGDFRKMWAVWRSWMNAGEEVRNAMQERGAMFKRMEAEKEESDANAD